jgi:hypothetical protein
MQQVQKNFKQIIIQSASMKYVAYVRRFPKKPDDKRISAPRCFQWVKKEDRGKSGTHELLAWPLLRIRCIMKRNGGK